MKAAKKANYNYSPIEFRWSAPFRLGVLRMEDNLQTGGNLPVDKSYGRDYFKHCYI